jgi:hypothetical protein
MATKNKINAKAPKKAARKAAPKKAPKKGPGGNRKAAPKNDSKSY